MATINNFELEDAAQLYAEPEGRRGYDGFIAGAQWALDRNAAEIKRLREALGKMVEEMQVFLDVSLKIHFPDAREAQEKAREALRESAPENGAGE